jgi:hypothetical protein
MADMREGKYDATLTKPSMGMWGVSNATDGRQGLPDPALHNDGVYDASSVIKQRDDADLLGETIAEESSMRDDDYPSVPTSGINGNTDVAFDSVAPYKYPDFGDWPGGTPGNSFLPGFVKGD